jgi:hypothetical protein
MLRDAGSWVEQRLRFLRELGCESTLEGESRTIRGFQLQCPVHAFCGCVCLIVAQIQAGEYYKEAREGLG